MTSFLGPVSLVRRCSAFGDAQRRYKFAILTSHTPISMTFLMIQRETLSYFPAKCLFASLMRFRGIYRNITLTLELRSNFFEGSIFTLALLNAIIATAVMCLRSDGTDNVEGHCQKLYCDIFASLLSKAFDQVLDTLRTITQLCCPTELSLSAPSIDNGFQMPETVRDTITEIYVPR